MRENKTATKTIALPFEYIDVDRYMLINQLNTLCKCKKKKDKIVFRKYTSTS